MKSIRELLRELIASLKIVPKDYPLTDDVQYQELFEEKKKLESSDLPKGVWAEENSLNWQYIQDKSLDIMLKKGRDCKLLSIWAEAYVSLNGLASLDDVLQVVLLVLQNDPYLSTDEDEQKLGLIKYLDKHLSKAIQSSNLNFGSAHEINLLQFENFHLENYAQYRDIASYFSPVNAQKLREIYEHAKETFTSIELFLKEARCFELSGTGVLIEQINNFLAYCSAMRSVPETVSEEIVSENTENKSIFYYRDQGYKSIEQGLAILERADPQNIAIPLLKKVMQWKDLPLLDIFAHVGTSAEIEAFIKILKG